MFTFYFNSRLQWYYKRTIKNEPIILFKLTMVGPYITFYREGDNTYNFLRDYDLVMRSFIEHPITHGENILERFLFGDFRDTHTHLTLPCKKNIIEELRDLLDSIAKNNQPDKKLIDDSLISNCIQAYRDYLNQSCVNEHIKNVNALLMKWIAPYKNGWIRILEKESQHANNTEIYIDSDSVGLAILQYLNKPNQNSFEIFRNKLCDFFELLNKTPVKFQEMVIKEIDDLMPYRQLIDLINLL